MPTAFTHALVGAAIPEIAPHSFPRWRLAVCCALLAAAPDLDVVAFKLGIPYAHPLGHRGLTHSLLFAMLMGPLVAFVVVPRAQRAGRAFLRAALIFTLALASHGLLDALTDAGRGIGILVPLDNARYFFPFRPLETSPVNPARFFSLQAFSILRSEILWVWVPTALALTTSWLVRRRGNARVTDA